MNLEENIKLMVGEVVRVAKDKLTGKLIINIHMTEGAVGQINIITDRNLKQKSSNSAKNAN